MAVPLQVFQAPTLDAEDGGRLGSSGDFYDCRALERGHFNFRAQRGLHKADGHFAEQIITIALEDLMRLDMQHDV